MTTQQNKEKNLPKVSKDTNSQGNTNKRGFASMPHDEVVGIAKKGGEARAAQLGHEGYVELGHKGGEARSHHASQEEKKQTSNKKRASSKP